YSAVCHVASIPPASIRLHKGGGWCFSGAWGAGMTATESDAYRRLADHLGLLPAYHDIQGTLRVMGHETRLALLAAMGCPCRSPADAMHHLMRLEAEAARRLAPPDIIALEGEGVRIPLTGAAAWRLRDDYTGEVLAAGAAAGEIVLAPMGPGLRHLELEGE